MAIHKTERNFVYAYDPQPDDVLVQVGWAAPRDDGPNLRPVTLRYLPISEYAETVEWAKGMADKMAYPIHVLPLNHNDILRTGRWTPFANMLATLNDQERGELRRDVVNSMCEIMRDCDDWEVRADAHDILTQLKVIHHD